MKVLQSWIYKAQEITSHKCFQMLCFLLNTKYLSLRAWANRISLNYFGLFGAIYLSFVSWCSNWRATVLWLMKPCTYQNLLDSWDVKDHLTDPFDFKVAILIFSPSSSISRSRYWTKTRRPTSRQCPPTGGCPSGSRPSETWSPSARRCWLCSGRKRCLPDLSVRFYYNFALLVFY